MHHWDATGLLAASGVRVPEGKHVAQGTPHEGGASATHSPCLVPARVLVVSPNAFLRFGVSHRLADLTEFEAAVTLAGDATGLDTADYDVVIMGPYDDLAERDRIAAALAAPGGIPAVIEIEDPPLQGVARIVRRGVDGVRGAAEAVAVALTAPAQRMEAARV